ncbi:C-3',4' desaturase CrtD [Desertifilum sp. FACHB-1129]|uniref:C-3',4' desaturase CrtD n=1 Tax=Desertifilum tharense IPPAS B-1220 TaxID=1781255 RepID=A0A1E5QFM7_9CYAN|nr:MULTISPECIES: C-3',4' desaturase CrtD [Desertifilum]MDA0213279.1 C-3',4' desaturase CrtD [Cyanobacteria bacterium FC1]MBD2310340.1 C-3',4' desaturase CrtD [Desertifilum sp. FACHB-1129]MBD2321791.1 C-3',4' desaturase CrtD [Desertifilum sp. FACHB-866]MBD2331918.1 C-3',4' desaturase CrtD [Desertifilum sp. FACHB-868]OEJ73485.1 C-3',4' desaturase CrtD [Desertifilum tharense IPPAS B-1220]
MSSTKPRVVVIGAGIGGLTAAALLAHQNYPVTAFDLAIVPGGCASTFKRKGFTFDVGATQVAGLEPGGIHKRIFDELELEIPDATPCDPACAVFLPTESQPIQVWRDPERWKAERQQQFPGSEPFWQLLNTLFQASWKFQGRDPVLPPRNLWDLGQLIKAVRPDTLITVPFTLATVGDALRWFGLADNLRLRTFLDMQLKLYSQVDAEETALLYAATALSVSQEPQGLYHLQGSMQALSDRLCLALERERAKLRMRHRVERIHTHNGIPTGVTVRNAKTGETWIEPADIIIANVTVQNLIQLLDGTSDTTTQQRMAGYRRRVDKLPDASGAFVIYLGVDQSAIPPDCPPHLQFLYDYDGPIGENNSLFVSVSHPGDGRAPQGKATIIASSFTDPRAWWQCSDYQALKQHYTDSAIARLSQYFHLTPETLIHIEAATPRTFAHFTGRDRGIVGGIGQRLPTFGPFGFANRTPLPNLWLVGDSTHPGEGTAGVSYSALTVVRQILS